MQMALENEIASLTSAINRLADILDRNSVLITAETEESLGAMKIADAEKIWDASTELSDTTETEAPSETSTVTAEDCRQLCLTIVRKKRELKSKVTDTIASFGNAKKVDDVANADIPYLHKLLTAILEDLQ
jgi:hypothetical protein